MNLPSPTARRVFAAAAALCLATAAQAGDFTATGTMTFHNDLVMVDFSLAGAATDRKSVV